MSDRYVSLNLSVFAFAVTFSRGCFRRTGLEYDFVLLEGLTAGGYIS